MKINESPERLPGVEQNRPQQARTVGKPVDEEFGSLLARQLSQSDGSAGAAPQASPLSADPLFPSGLDAVALSRLQTEGSGGSDAGLVEALTDGISSGLTGLEDYAAMLRSPSEHALKKAWTSLASTEDSIAGMRRSLEKLITVSQTLNLEKETEQYREAYKQLQPET